MTTTGYNGNSPLTTGQPSRLKPGGIVLLVIGTILGLVGTGLCAAGIAFTVASAAQRDDGFFTSPTETFSSGSYALTSPSLDVADGLKAATGAPFDIATLRLEATSNDPNREVFIGIAPRTDVDAYLSRVHHSEIWNVRLSPFNVEYRDVAGTQSPGDPAAEGFWTESATGTGTQHVDWTVRSGSWSVVVMNADASPGATVDLAAGVHSGLVLPLAIGLLVSGAVMFIVGVALTVMGAAILGRQLEPLEPPAGGAAGGAALQPVYPVRLTGHLDSPLSRGLWIVKWLLGIPHFLLLAFLWFAFVAVTIIAGFAILFTGRYPRSLFWFNVGVLRWNWRVSFYAYSALGTDRYPPFTLARTDYPADFDVHYPERLSHGLVLVKWWLLAIPHLVIVAILGGGAWWWWSWTGQPWFGQSWAGVSGINNGWGSGVSLLGLLVFITGVILLFSGRYQHPLFNLIMGINRWVYRVIAYTALMRDEYPPFRLDQGPAEPDQTEPGSGPAAGAHG
ncbi:DUF4389 domain-containing protein [Glaciibacter sp. 2TAF33]|uniref:DUF4389 domain-containing protein n=1 Tax=Glaciibacter sp. 2TAF33 TaxID=3233015 RepID=UPI003F90159E